MGESKTDNDKKPDREKDREMEWEARREKGREGAKTEGRVGFNSETQASESQEIHKNVYILDEHKLDKLF